MDRPQVVTGADEHTVRRSAQAGLAAADRSVRRAARRLGWAALIAAIAATTTFVPPLVMPKTQLPQAIPPTGARGPGATARPPFVSAPPSAVPTAAVPTTAPPVVVPPAVPSVAVSRSVAASVSLTTPSFAPLAVHAADAANLRSGARVIECDSCEGGSRVGYIGGPNTLAIRVGGVAVAGQRKLTVTYETAEVRTLEIAVNEGPVYTLTLAGAGNWLIPATVSLEVFVPAGTSWIRFFNDAGSAPDINQIAIT